MSAIYMDSFDQYGLGTFGSGNMLDGAWAQIPNPGGPGVPSWGPRTGPYAIQSAAIATPYRYVLPATKTNMFQSFGFSCDGLPAGNFRNTICSFAKADNTIFAILWLNSDGSITLTNGSNTPIASTQGPVIVSRSWHFLEMNMDATGGTFTLRIDDATGSDTPAIHATSVSWGSLVVGQLHYLTVASDVNVTWLDDLFIRDTAGGINDGWLGDRRIAALFVNADTNVNGWTPSYYHCFGDGILRLGYRIPNNSSVQNPSAAIATGNASSLEVTNQDFTIETMVRFDSLPAASTYTAIFSQWNTGANSRSFRLIYGGSSFNNSCLEFDYSVDGTTVVSPIVYPWTPELNTWYSIAIVRASGELLLFVDGEQFGLPISDGGATYFSGTQDMSVGSDFNATTTLSGRMDETRFTNGYARYTGPYAMPTDAFPTGGSDPHWADVVWLMNYDSGITDSSSYGRTVSAFNGAISFQPGDGPDVGVYSTVNKQIPDDNTFIEAGLINATNIYTMTSQPSNGNTVTVGTSDGSTPAVYTFKTSVTTAFDVLIDTTAQNSLLNLLNAINAGPGSGTKYGTGTTSNFDVNATQLPTGQFLVTANLAGTGGNAIPSTKTGTAMSWATTTLTGGADIPGPTEFRFQRPPNNTTIISALQTTIRALKTDAGTANVQTTFIAPLGGEADGAIHALTITPVYYNDIIEEDPDTSGPLSPTTIINGKFEITRTS